MMIPKNTSLFSMMIACICVETQAQSACHYITYDAVSQIICRNDDSTAQPSLPSDKEDTTENIPPVTVGDEAEEPDPPVTAGDEAEESAPPATVGDEAEEPAPPVTADEVPQEAAEDETPVEQASAPLPDSGCIDPLELTDTGEILTQEPYSSGHEEIGNIENLPARVVNGKPQSMSPEEINTAVASGELIAHGEPSSYAAFTDFYVFHVLHQGKAFELLIDARFGERAAIGDIADFYLQCYEAFPAFYLNGLEEMKVQAISRAEDAIITTFGTANGGGGEIIMYSDYSAMSAENITNITNTCRHEGSHGADVAGLFNAAAQALTGSTTEDNFKALWEQIAELDHALHDAEGYDPIAFEMVDAYEDPQTGEVFANAYASNNYTEDFAVFFEKYYGAMADGDGILAASYRDLFPNRATVADAAGKPCAE